MICGMFSDLRDCVLTRLLTRLLTATGEAFPRFLVVEVQHATPYYDDSYAVNSATMGPWGDAIMYELLPAIEEQFRGIGEGWARFTYGL